MNDTTTLIVAERDDPTREYLVNQLLADEFIAHGAAGEQEARVKLAHFRPDMLILGALDGAGQLGLLRAVRLPTRGSLPTIVIGEDASEVAELRTFEAGCDDYLCRPVSYPRLLARVRAVRRRAEGGFVARRRIGAIEIDAVARRVTVCGHRLHLSRMEFELLLHLAARPTRVCTKEELLREVWGYLALGRTRTVDAHACRLRRKLALAGAPHLVVNSRGVGYRLSVGEAAAGPGPTPLSAAHNGTAA